MAAFPSCPEEDEAKAKEATRTTTRKNVCSWEGVRPSRSRAFREYTPVTRSAVRPPAAMRHEKNTSTRPGKKATNRKQSKPLGGSGLGGPLPPPADPSPRVGAVTGRRGAGGAGLSLRGYGTEGVFLLFPSRLAQEIFGKKPQNRQIGLDGCSVFWYTRPCRVSVLKSGPVAVASSSRPWSQPVEEVGPVSILLHVTPRRNLPSIYALGIDPSFSLGQFRVCWFVSLRRWAWAVAHVADRHGISPAEVAVIRVSVRATSYKRWVAVLGPASAWSGRSCTSPSPSPPESRPGPAPSARRGRVGRFASKSERMKR